VMKKLPLRTFIFVGDSGEKDPEIYAAAAAEFPGRVLAVCIRDVSPAGETAKRVNSLAENGCRWIIFSDGTGLKKEKLL
ncbi:MAG: phosphatase domain-containing protein, partial [Spirochaetota bacterium]